MDTADTKKAYRLKLFQDAIRFKTKPERVPNLSYFVTWPFFDAGYTIKEAVCDYDKIEKAVEKHCTQYKWDGIYCYGTRNPYKVTQKFGTEYYIITDDNVNIKGYSLIEHDELAELRDDPIKTMWTKMMPRKFPNFNFEMKLETMQNVLNERLAFISFAGKMNKRGSQEWGYPDLTDNSLGFMYFGLEYLFSMARGIKGMALDMRRDIELVKDTVDVLDEMWVEPSFKLLENSEKGMCPSSAWDTQICLLAPTVMNAKQYEYLYYPRIKRILDECVAKEKTIRVMYEGDTERFIPYYDNCPKGTVTFFIEQDDIFKLRKEYPDYTYCGGMPVDYLGYKSKEECVDYARKLVNEVGGDGGFIITQNKMGTSRFDATSENLKAYCDFIAEGNY